MADNVAITAGSGTTVRTLADASTVEYQVGALAWPTTISPGANVMQLVDATHGLPVNVLNASIAVTGTFFQATQPISAASLPLPTGAATSAAQTTAQTSLTTLVANSPALGQALAAASVPVILPAATITTLTPPAAISGFALESSGNLAAIAGKDFATQTTLTLLNNKVALETGGNLATIAGAVSSSKVQANVAQINGVTPLMGNGVTGTGSQRVTIASDQTAFGINLTAGTTGGSTPYHLISAATNNAQSVKATAGILYSYSAFNTSASLRYLKFYDKASAPSPASDTPILVIMLPPNNGGVVKSFPVGVQCSSGIAFAIVSGIADNDNTAISANDCVVNITFK